LNIIAKNKLLHGLKDLGKNYLCRVVGKDAQNTYENMKYHFTSYLILKNYIEYQNAISMCYKQRTLHVPSRKVKAHVIQTIINTLVLVIKWCVLNQTQGYWLYHTHLFLFSPCALP
jgi:hypothetical protein